MQVQAFTQYLESQILPSDCGRIFHGRGGLFSGCEHLCLDWYQPVLLLTSFKEIDRQTLSLLVESITDFWQKNKPSVPLNLVFQYRAANKTHTQIITGSVPEPHIVSENGMVFYVHLLRGQNHGLFLDMRNGRAWVKAHANHKKVLNLFAYTCGFSVAAKLGGASQVVNIDMSKGALSIGNQNHHLNNITHGVSYLGHDIFKSWGKLKKLGPYDMVIVDPPSNQKGSFVATKDYGKLLRRLPELLVNNAQLLLCLNAPELGVDFLKQQVAEYSPDFEFIERLANPESFQDVASDKALKTLRYDYQII